MIFDEAYKKYRTGMATDEEIEFVESEIAKARALAGIIDADEPQAAPVNKADMVDVRKAQKKHSIKSIIRNAIISVIVVCLVIGAILGGVFGAAAGYATQNTDISMDGARAAALDVANAYVMDKPGLATSSAIVTEIDRDIQLEPNLVYSRYLYYVNVDMGLLEIEVVVDGSTGETRIIDIDRD